MLARKYKVNSYKYMFLLLDRVEESEIKFKTLRFELPVPGVVIASITSSPASSSSLLLAPKPDSSSSSLSIYEVSMFLPLVFLSEKTSLS
jgi:hypothetical protein